MSDQSIDSLPSQRPQAPNGASSGPRRKDHSAPAQLQPGVRVGSKYRLVREIGRGGMGSVWAAVQQSLGREVAIKFLLVQPGGEEAAQKRFIDEAKSAAVIRNRFVVEVHDYGSTEEGLPYMVLELLDGIALADFLDQRTMPARQAIRIAAMCLSGLQAVHEAGILHRDLKPENIMLLEDSEGMFPKLIDFGISKKVDEAVSHSMCPPPPPGKRPRQLTVPGLTVGTPWYMSPEQHRGCSDLDARSDVFALAVILFEWITGYVPFADAAVSGPAAITAEAGAALKTRRPDLGEPLSNVLARALRPEREERFSTAAEMRAALMDVLDSVPADAVTRQAGQGPKPTDPALRAAPDPFASPEEEDFSHRFLRSPLGSRRLLGVAAAAAVVSIAGVWLFAREPASTAGEKDRARATSQSAEAQPPPTAPASIAQRAPARTSETPPQEAGAPPAATAAKPEAGKASAATASQVTSAPGGSVEAPAVPALPNASAAPSRRTKSAATARRKRKKRRARSKKLYGELDF